MGIDTHVQIGLRQLLIKVLCCYRIWQTVVMTNNCFDVLTQPVVMIHLNRLWQSAVTHKYALM